MPTRETSSATSERRLISNALVAMLNVIVGSVLLFALYRFLLRQLGPETLGVWSLLVASVSAARLSDLGVAAGATRFVAVARAAGDNRQAAHVAETATVTLLVLGALVALVAQLLLPSLLESFLPTAHLNAARQALPLALVALVLGLAGGAVQSALDGCQRVDLRVWIALFGQFVLLIAAVLWVKRYGLAGVAAAQALQALVILAGGWILLRGQLRDLSVVPLRWRYATFRRILTYSVLFQINNVLVLIIDPMVKFLLARFGGLSATAYMDMAMQLVQKIRQLPMAATQVLVPAMAQASELGQGRVRELYTRSYRTIFAATISIFCLLASLISVISILWIGHQEPLFIGMAWICILGMSVNTLGTPSYFSNLGTGDVGTNTIGHALAALLAAALGWWGGWAWGAFGVGAGYVAGLAVGGLYIQVLFVRRLGLKLSSLIPAESRWLLISSVFAVGICLAADKVVLRVPYFDAPHISAQLVRMAILVAIFMLVAGSSMWMHPLRRAVSARIVETLR